MRKPLSFPTVMKLTALLTLAATVILASLHHAFRQDWLLSAAITAGTAFYHFAMRLLVGTIIPRCNRHPMKYPWFQPRPFEAKLYEVLKVKRWKDHMPTYDPASFSLRENTLEQILDNSCISEAVHEAIVLLSFIPLVFAHWWGAFPVFLITSVLSALFDSSFAIIQRYNRPRLVRILHKRRRVPIE